MNTDIQMLAKEEYEYRKAQLLDGMKQFLDAYGRDEIKTVAQLLKQASVEKVVTNNPMKTIADAFRAGKTTNEVAF